MRTTVTLDPDTDAIVRRLMRQRGLSFKGALNEAIRAGRAAPAPAAAFRTQALDMGQAALPLDKALRLAADLEDDEIVRKMALRK